MIQVDGEKEDDMIYVPYEYEGDRRKREAKRHKTHTVIVEDEIDLDAMIRESQNTNPKIMELEAQLADLKNKKMSKKDL